MNKNLNRRIHPIIKIDGFSPKYLIKMAHCVAAFFITAAICAYMASVSEPLDAPIGVEIPESGV